MPDVKFNPELSLGNIITIITLIVGLTIGWQAMAEDVKSNRDRLAQLGQRVDDVETKLEKVTSDVLDEKVKITGLLAGMQSDIRYMRIAMDELKKQEAAEAAKP